MSRTIDSKGHSSNQTQTMCLRVGWLLLRNTLGFRRIRQIHTFKLPPLQSLNQIYDTLIYRHQFQRNHQL